MTLYQITGMLAQIFTFLIPPFLTFFKSKSFFSSSIIVFFTLGSTFFYDYKLFNIISLWQIMLIFISLRYFTLQKEINENKMLRKLKNISHINVLYFTLITFIFYYFGVEYSVLGGLAQNQLRPFVQTIQHALIFMSMIVVAAFPQDKSIKILNCYFRALWIFCLVGLMQGIIFQITGYDILPMRKDFISELNGVSVIGQTGWLRITAGVGEPKQLSKFLNIGLALVLLMPEYIQLKRKRLLYVIPFVIGIIMTSSTTGYIIAVFIFGLSYLKNSKKNILIIVPGLLILTILSFYVFNSEIVSDKLVTASIDQAEIIGLENSDSAVVRFFIDKPYYLFTGVGISNAVSYANSYVPPISSYINDAPYTLRRGIIKIIAEGGILGLLIYFYTFKLILKKVNDHKELLYFAVFQIFLILFLTIEAIFPITMLTLGLLVSLSNTHHFKEERL